MSKPKVGKLVYKQGDLFEALKPKANVVVAHVCNCHAVFGSGFAASVREKYPKTNKKYIEYCELYNLSKDYRPMTCFTEENFGYFANMICQTSFGPTRNAKYPDLVDCMWDVAAKINYDTDPKEVYCPKFGAGTCHMNWAFIEELIKDIWLPAGLNVTVFTL